jgi:hypothetical protein
MKVGFRPEDWNGTPRLRCPLRSLTPVVHLWEKVKPVPGFDGMWKTDNKDNVE